MATLAAAVVSVVCSCTFSNVCVHILGIQGLSCVCVCHAHTHDHERALQIAACFAQARANLALCQLEQLGAFFVRYIQSLVAC